MRIVVAKRMSRRGEGLGNELIPWAKGWIASQELRAHLVGPSWGLNRRRYSRNFRTDKLDWLLEDTLLRLPHIPFTEEDYRATGETDFGRALAKWAQTSGLDRRRFFIVSVEGMWGGYAAIRNARPFLWSQLVASRDALRNVYSVLSRLDRNKLFVAVHLRTASEGFAPTMPGESLRGRFNIVLPGDWYTSVCSEIKRTFHDRVQFWFFTDRRSADFDALVCRFSPGQSEQSGLTECSDLLLMALADLRVCSVSSYSMAASFLADGPYLWYEPQLSLRDGLYTMWGDEQAQQGASWPTRQGRQSAEHLYGSPDEQAAQVDFPGSAMDIGDPLPHHLAALLEQRLRIKDTRTNLLEYGCLPAALLRPQALYQ